MLTPFNFAGTYCPPLAVFTDIAFLRTLDDRNLANGSAEIMKMACIKDRRLFELLETHAATLMASHYQVCLQHHEMLACFDWWRI